MNRDSDIDAAAISKLMGMTAVDIAKSLVRPPKEQSEEQSEGAKKTALERARAKRERRRARNLHNARMMGLDALPDETPDLDIEERVTASVE